MYVDNKLVINNEYKFETRTFTVDLNDLISLYETYQFNYEKCISGPVIKQLTITSSEEILDTDSFYIVYVDEYNGVVMTPINLSTLTDNFPTSFYKRIDANTIELSLNPYEVFGGSCCMLHFTHSLDDADYGYATEQTYTGVKVEEYIKYVTVNNGDLTLSADGSTVEFDSNSLSFTGIELAEKTLRITSETKIESTDIFFFIMGHDVINSFGGPIDSINGMDGFYFDEENNTLLWDFTGMEADSIPQLTFCLSRVPSDVEITVESILNNVYAATFSLAIGLSYEINKPYYFDELGEHEVVCETYNKNVSLDFRNSCLVEAHYDCLRGCKELGYDSPLSDCYYLEVLNIPDTVTSVEASYIVGYLDLHRNLKKINVETTNKTLYSPIGSNCCIRRSDGELLLGTSESVIPKEVKTIGRYAFKCSEITSVVIPDGVTSIGSYAFQYCSKLTSVVIGSGVRDMGMTVFEKCTNLKTVTIKPGVTSIGYSAFRDCSSLETINVPDSLTSIADSVFSGCTSLPVYDNVRYADTYCVGVINKGITSCTIKEGTRWIGYSAFSGCTSLATINIPDSVTNIEGYAIRGCTNLTGELVIPDGVTSIGYSAFRDCKNLTSIVIPDSVTTIGAGAFADCSNLSQFNFGSGITEISSMLLSGCTKITSLYIPQSVTSIAADAFNGMTKLSSIVVDENNNTYDSRDNCNCIIQTESNALMKGCNSSTIPNSIVTIVGNAFKNCTGLTGNIVFPDSLTTVGIGSFYGCSGVTSFDFGTGLITIGESAFTQCTGIKEISLPDSTQSIGNYAFSGCTNIETIYIGSGLTTLPYYIGGLFDGCTKRSSITVSPLNTTYDSRNNCNAIIKTSTNELVLGSNNTIIPDTVVKIGRNAFEDCVGLTGEVVIPNSVTRIDTDAFISCSGITSLIIGSSVSFIDEDAFYGCSGLSSIKCLGTTAPNLDSEGVFYRLPSTGKLYYPAGSDYSEWKSELPSGWTMVTF